MDDAKGCYVVRHVIKTCGQRKVIYAVKKVITGGQRRVDG